MLEVPVSAIPTCNTLDSTSTLYSVPCLNHFHRDHRAQAAEGTPDRDSGTLHLIFAKVDTELVLGIL